MRGPRISRVPVWVLLLALSTGCSTLSINTRPRSVPKGSFRIGVGQGLSRDLSADFSRAAPSSSDDSETTVAWFSEITFHYGLFDHMDIGLRLRPWARGGKLETHIDILPEGWAPFEVGLELGIDYFHRPLIQTGCTIDGCFYQRYTGAAADGQLVISKRLFANLTIFGSARYGLLWIDGRQTFRRENFESVRIDKSTIQGVGGLMIAMEFNLGPIVLAPQFHLFSVLLPNGKRRAALVPSMDLAFEI